MAKTVSEEEIQLRKRARRRLVGAVAMVTAAVVILPMILDSKPEQRTHEIDIRIPSEEAIEEFSAEAGEPVEAPREAISEKPADGMQPQPQPQSQQQSAPVSSVTSSPSGNSPARTESDPGKNLAADGRFVVQLGAFSDPEKARRQVKSLKSRDITAHTITVNSGQEEITRVRLGYFSTWEEAENMREALKKLGLDGVVTEK